MPVSTNCDHLQSVFAPRTANVEHVLERRGLRGHQ